MLIAVQHKVTDILYYRFGWSIKQVPTSIWSVWGPGTNWVLCKYLRPAPSATGAFLSGMNWGAKWWHKRGQKIHSLLSDEMLNNDFPFKNHYITRALIVETCLLFKLQNRSGILNSQYWRHELLGAIFLGSWKGLKMQKSAKRLEKVSILSRLEICQNIYTTKFSCVRILHIENA